jgi:nucleosome assembly protein 1-like 1
MSAEEAATALKIDDDEKEIEQKMIKVISLMPAAVQNRFKVLKVLSDKRSKLSDEFDKEIKLLEEKIAAKKKPLYEERRKIIAGEITDFTIYVPKFTEAHAKLEAHKVEVISKKKEGEKADEPEEIKKVDVENLKGVQGVPDFWYRSIKNNQMIYELVKEKDEAILPYLRHIDTERTTHDPAVPESRKTLTVNFHFAENEYFTEKTLSLKVVYRPETEDDVEKIEGTNITWADETKDPTKKKIKKKQKHKKTNETRTIVKTVEAESFFNVFTSRVAPEEGADMDEEEENELRDKIDMAMNLAEDVDDVLIPDALEYYLGLNDDMFDAEDMEDEGDEDGSGGEGSDDDGDSKKKSKKGGDKKAEGGAPAGGEQKQECKQQ